VYHSICEICEDITTNPRAVHILYQNAGELYKMMEATQEMREEALKKWEAEERARKKK